MISLKQRLTSMKRDGSYCGRRVELYVLRSAGVDTLDAETALRLLESNLQTFDEHRRALKSEQQELHSENRVRGWPTPRPRLIAAE